MSAPELPQFQKGFLGQRDVTILASLAVNVQQHTGGIHITDLQAATFIQAQATGVDGRQAYPVNEHANTTQNLAHFLTAENGRERFGFGRTQQLQTGPGTLERVLEEELDGAQRDRGRPTSDFTFQGQMQKITPQFLLCDLVWRFATELGQVAYGSDIRRLRLG